jgi:SWI/SNF-related matrix-associated actin-dependent regulator of chromatin subfamily A member 5
MAPSRTRKEESDGPSTAEVSANEDVEMQDQEDRVNGFKKFGVSGNRPRRDRPGESHDAQQLGLQQTS